MMASTGLPTQAGPAGQRGRLATPGQPGWPRLASGKGDLYESASRVARGQSRRALAVTRRPDGSAPSGDGRDGTAWASAGWRRSAAARRVPPVPASRTGCGRTGTRPVTRHYSLIWGSLMTVLAARRRARGVSGSRGGQAPAVARRTGGRRRPSLVADREARMTFPNPPVATIRVSRITQRNSASGGNGATRIRNFAPGGRLVTAGDGNMV